MNLKIVAFGLIAGAVVGYLRVAKGGGVTASSPPMYRGMQ